MPDTLLTSGTSFSLTRVVDAPREKVFDAWTQPAQITRWFTPTGHTADAAEVDLRVGGAYAIGIRPADGGEVFYVRGTYVEVVRPEKIVFTWAWDEDDGPGHESLVTVSLTTRGSKTEIVLTHERLADETSRDNHLDGWTSCLNGLAAYVE